MQWSAVCPRWSSGSCGASPASAWSAPVAQAIASRKPAPALAVIRPLPKRNLKQLGCLGRNGHKLAKRRPQTRGRTGCIIEVVVIENHMQLARCSSELLASRRYLSDLVIAVIIIETSSYGFPREIGTRIASVQPQIRQRRICDLIQIRRHNGEMLCRRSIDVNKTCAMPFKKLDGLSELLAGHPVAISEFNRQLIIAQHIDQKIEFFQLVPAG